MLNIEVVPDNNRGSWLVRHFKNPTFDLTVFHVSDNIFKDYVGHYWVYAEAVHTPDDGEEQQSNAPFLYPQVEGDITLVNPFSNKECEIEPILGGMVICLYALNLACEKYGSDGEHYGDLYYSLRDAVLSRCSELKRMDVWSALID
jgi:hypothetical protein